MSLFGKLFGKKNEKAKGEKKLPEEEDGQVKYMKPKETAPAPKAPAAPAPEKAETKTEAPVETKAEEKTEKAEKAPEVKESAPKAEKQPEAPKAEKPAAKKPAAKKETAPAADEKKTAPAAKEEKPAEKKSAPTKAEKVEKAATPKTEKPAAPKAEKPAAKKPAAPKAEKPAPQNETKPAEDTNEEAESIATAETSESIALPTKTGPVGKFDLKKSKDGRFVFNLLAANRVIVATSQVYSSSTAAMNGIHSVIANAAKAPVEDQTLKNYTPVGYPKWEIYLDKGNQYRFRLNASNGSCICHSQGYTTKASCKNGIESIIRTVKDADTEKSYLKKDDAKK